MPHYHEALWTFVPVIKQLQTEGKTALLLLDVHDLYSAGMCNQLNLPWQRIPPLVWGRHLTGGLLQLLQEGWRARQFAQEFCQKVKPAAIVMTDDRRYVELFLIRQAKAQAIPTLVIMWAATNKPQVMREWRHKASYNNLASTWQQRLQIAAARLIAPQAILSHSDSQPLLWQPLTTILALRLFALYPSHPWLLGGGPADMIAVTGKHYQEMLLAHGIPAEKIHVTGHPRHDQLVRQGAYWRGEGRTQMCTEIDAPANKKLIILGAPPVSHIVQGTRAGHVTPEQMTRYLYLVIDDLLQLGQDYHLIVKVHPRDAHLDLTYLSNHRLPFTVVRDYDIPRIIAGSELLVCQGSTIVFDAHILGTPVVTFDFYQTPGYDMWQEAGGVCHITEPAAFLPTVQKVLLDNEVQLQLAAARQRFLQSYVTSDGQAVERVTRLLTDAIEVASNKHYGRNQTDTNYR